jgi:hypothetical protein
MKGWVYVALAVALVACSVALWSMPSDRSRLVITVMMIVILSAWRWSC